MENDKYRANRENDLNLHLAYTACTERHMEYSPSLVALARSLDCAEVCVRAANWHFSQIEEDAPEQFNDAGEYHAWTWGNILNLKRSLPGLRAAFLSMVKEESKGWDILPGKLGDALPPKEVEAMMREVIERPLFRLLPSNESPAKLLELPDIAKSKTGEDRVVVWDDEIYAVPDTMTDSFVEVWFRRAFGWSDGGAYPVYLVKRKYGWQAYGIER